MLGILAGLALMFLIHWVLESVGSKTSSAQTLPGARSAGQSNDETTELKNHTWDGSESAFLVIAKERCQKITTGSTRSYYLENFTIDFLRDALISSPYSLHAPRSGEYLRQWTSRSSLPSELQKFKDVAYDMFEARRRELTELARKELEQKHENQAVQIFKSNEELVKKFLEISYRKVSTRDEYGDENLEAFDDEALRLFEKLSKTEAVLASEMNSLNRSGGRNRKAQIEKLTTSWSASFTSPVMHHLHTLLKSAFQAFYSEQKAAVQTNGVQSTSDMDGIEFEVFLMDLFRTLGATGVCGTSTTGDQGADVLFDYMGLKVVVQAKRYSGNVGNKAVQEVVAAKAYYNADEAWVVTNSKFTAAAKELAQSNGVTLVDGRTLEHFESFFKDHFSSAKQGTGA